MCARHMPELWLSHTNFPGTRYCKVNHLWASPCTVTKSLPQCGSCPLCIPDGVPIQEALTTKSRTCAGQGTCVKFLCEKADNRLVPLANTIFPWKRWHRVNCLCACPWKTDRISAPVWLLSPRHTSFNTAWHNFVWAIAQFLECLKETSGSKDDPPKKSIVKKEKAISLSRPPAVRTWSATTRFKRVPYPASFLVASRVTQWVMNDI